MSSESFEGISDMTTDTDDIERSIAFQVIKACF